MLFAIKQDQIPPNSFLILLLTYLIGNKLGPTDFFFFFFTHASSFGCKTLRICKKKKKKEDERWKCLDDSHLFQLVASSRAAAAIICHPESCNSYVTFVNDGPPPPGYNLDSGLDRFYLSSSPGDGGSVVC